MKTLLVLCTKKMKTKDIIFSKQKGQHIVRSQSPDEIAVRFF